MRFLSVFLIFLLSVVGPLSFAGVSQDILTEDQKILHLLGRITFGARPGDMERVKRIGVKAFLEKQLAPSRIDDSGVTGRLAKLGTLKMTPKELFAAYPPPGRNRRLRSQLQSQDEKKREEARMEASRMRRGQRHVQLELTQAKLIRAVYSERQLLEMMVDFWMNHFNVFLLKNWNRLLTTDFEEGVIRPNALGSFEHLLGAVAKSPAMLYYLDNWLSSAPEEVVKQRMRSKGLRKRSGRLRSMSREDRYQLMAGIFGPTPALFRAKGLNENYARELLELHTVGVNGGYTQEDVIQVARCFTGWTLAAPQQGAGFYFQPLMHDPGEKVVLGQTIRSGGVEEGEQVLKLLAHRPETARFIATKLVRRFVADDPPQDLVEAATQTFQRTRGAIKEVLRTIFTSPLFYAPQFVQAKTKKPLELVASSLRAVQAEFDDTRPLLWTLSEMGEAPYLCRTPDGYPDQASAWINTNSLLKRLNFAMGLAAGRMPGVRVNLRPAQPLFDQMGLPDPNLPQTEATRELLEGNALGRDLQRVGDLYSERSLIVTSAFKLGSPQFQKR